MYTRIPQKEARSGEGNRVWLLADPEILRLADHPAGSLPPLEALLDWLESGR